MKRTEPWPTTGLWAQSPTKRCGSTSHFCLGLHDAHTHKLCKAIHSVPHLPSARSTLRHVDQRQEFWPQVHAIPKSPGAASHAQYLSEPPDRLLCSASWLDRLASLSSLPNLWAYRQVAVESAHWGGGSVLTPMPGGATERRLLVREGHSECRREGLPAVQ